jgi:hypothetical protein
MNLPNAHGHKTTYALFFTAPLKRVVGVCGFGGVGGKKTASILSKWLWYWLFNIMLLCDSLCGWMLA